MDDMEVKLKMDSDSDAGTKSGADLNSGAEVKAGLELKVYKKRWWVLFALSLLNFCGALNWLTFSTVPYSAADYYDTDVNAINLLSLIFLFSAIPIGTFATFLIERFGLRPSYYFCGWTCCVGSLLRIVSTIDSLGSGRLAVLFVGQAIIAIGQPFSTYCPAKTAEAWFPEHERTVANLIGTVANPFGVVVVGLLSPLFETNDQLDATNLLIMTAVPSTITAIFVTFMMTSSNPPTPPTVAASKPTLTGKEILKNVKKVLCNPKYLILLLTVGGSLGVYSAFVTLIAQILCPYGYSSEIAGWCSAVLTFMGLIGGIPIGNHVDRRKQFSSTLKTCYGCVVVGLAIVAGVYQFYMDYYILILIAGIGFFSFAILPIGMELAAECTYPVGIATTSGLIVISGQIQSLILVVVMQSLSFPISKQRACELNSACFTNNCTLVTSQYGDDMTSLSVTEPPVEDDDQTTYDLTNSMYFCSAWIGAIFLVLLIFFKPEYKRMRAEAQHSQHTRGVSNEGSFSSDDEAKL